MKTMKKGMIQKTLKRIDKYFESKGKYHHDKIVENKPYFKDNSASQKHSLKNSSPNGWNEYLTAASYLSTEEFNQK
ncbi:MAG: hypothetical protein R2764_08295 [Bacteroidales bacterium]